MKNISKQTLDGGKHFIYQTKVDEIIRYKDDEKEP